MKVPFKGQFTREIFYVIFVGLSTATFVASVNWWEYLCDSSAICCVLHQASSIHLKTYVTLQDKMLPNNIDIPTSLHTRFKDASYTQTNCIKQCDKNCTKTCLCKQALKMLFVV